MRQPLTEIAIRQLPNPTKGSVKHIDPSLAGFGVRCTARSKSFFVMYGPERRLKTIGRWPEISLREARNEAKAILSAPRQENRTKRLQWLVREFLEESSTRLRPRTVQRYRDVLQHAPDIDPEEISTSVASTSHEIIAYKVLYNWSLRHGYVDRNPFQYKKVVYGKRERVLSPAELKAVWHYDRPPFSDIDKVLILTGLRRGEAVALQPEWILGDVCTIPGEFTKNHSTHTFPVGALAKQYLNVPFSFNGWGKSKARLDKETGVNDWTLHDLRRTFATIHAEIGTPIHVVEAMLNHKSGTISGVSAVYIKATFTKEMRTALTQYEEHIQTIIA